MVTRASIDAPFDPDTTYRTMVRMRLVDLALVHAWHDGLVPGEYHSGIGEEGIFGGVLAHLREGDSMALEHRGTGPLIGRGTDTLGLMLECLGSPDGMNKGMAGHMHLMDPDIPASCDGIVGSGAPLAAGQAVAHQQLGNGKVAIGVHGDGAMNQGMVMEAYNLAVAWKLPVVFIVKNNRWSITTHNKAVTGGSLAKRAKSFGLQVEQVDGRRVDHVHTKAGRLIARARAGRGPGLLLATCHRPGGHFEGDPLVKLLHHPLDQLKVMTPGLIKSALAHDGGSARARVAGLAELGGRIGHAITEYAGRANGDPLPRARRLIDPGVAEQIDTQEALGVREAIEAARSRVGVRPVFGTPATVALTSGHR